MALFDDLLTSGAMSASGLNASLQFGLRMCDEELIRSLVERGADPKDQKILAICAERHPNMLQLLLELGSVGKSRFVVPGFGTDALMAAIRCGQSGFENVRLLLDSGVVDAKGFSSSSFSSEDYYLSRNETPLGLAIRWSRKGSHANYEVIRRLLNQPRCDPNNIATCDHGVNQTAILEAIETKDKDLVELLISRGANVNHEASFGLKRTPLQKAVEVQSLELVNLLLNANADVNAKPSIRGGATALQLAAITGNCQIATILLAWGANLYTPPSEVNGRWPLEGAAENGRIEMISYLWRLDSEFCLSHYQRAMNLAEENGYLVYRNYIKELADATQANMLAINI